MGAAEIKHVKIKYTYIRYIAESANIEKILTQ